MCGHHLQLIKSDALEVGVCRPTGFAGDSNGQPVQMRTSGPSQAHVREPGVGVWSPKPSPGLLETYFPYWPRAVP